jgi:hypothetical protein
MCNIVSLGKIIDSQNTIFREKLPKPYMYTPLLDILTAISSLLRI